MKSQEQSTKKCYIVISHIRQLSPTGWQTTEEVEVTNNLKSRHLSGASVIINVMRQQFEKNRFMAESKLSPEHHIAYLAKYIENYKDQIKMILTK